LNKNLRSIRKSQFVMLTSLLAVILGSNLPIVPTSRVQKGKESFIFRVETKDLLRSLDYQVEELPSSFNYLTIQTIEDNQIVFEGNDWILHVKLNIQTIATIIQRVTYYKPPLKRNETRIVGLYVELDISYTDKESRILSTFKKVLLSEATSGEFNLYEYMEHAKSIPLKDVKFSFGQIEIVNKETNASLTYVEYDPETESYIRHISAKISFDLYYSTTLSGLQSALFIALFNLDITFTNQIFAAIVAFLIAYYQVRSGKEKVSKLEAKLLEQEIKRPGIKEEKEDPLMTLKIRYAKGEISKEEYEEMKRELSTS